MAKIELKAQGKTRVYQVSESYEYLYYKFNVDDIIILSISGELDD